MIVVFHFCDPLEPFSNHGVFTSYLVYFWLFLCKIIIWFWQITTRKGESLNSFLLLAAHVFSFTLLSHLLLTFLTPVGKKKSSESFSLSLNQNHSTDHSVHVRTVTGEKVSKTFLVLANEADSACFE